MPLFEPVTNVKINRSHDALRLVLKTTKSRTRTYNRSVFDLVFFLDTEILINSDGRIHVKKSRL